MKITPLEIRQKTFEKKLRGYDKDEVIAFLQSLSQEWEQIQEEVKELRLRNEAAEKEIKQLREVENSLFKTLKTAEDTGANLIDQATKTAELHMRETQMNADALLNEAKTKARTTIDNAEARARGILEKMDQDLQSLKMEYRSLENLRDIIISELRNLSNDTLNRVDKIETKAAQDAALVKERMAETAAAIAQEKVAEQPKGDTKPANTERVRVEPEAEFKQEEVEQVSEEIDWSAGDDKQPDDEGPDLEEYAEDGDEDVTVSWSDESDDEASDDDTKNKGAVSQAQQDSEVESDDEDSSFFDQIK